MPKRRPRSSAASVPQPAADLRQVAPVAVPVTEPAVDQIIRDGSLVQIFVRPDQKGRSLAQLASDVSVTLNSRRVDPRQNGDTHVVLVSGTLVTCGRFQALLTERGIRWEVLS
jgi:hypothetical protein